MSKATKKLKTNIQINKITIYSASTNKLKGSFLKKAFISFIRYLQNKVYLKFLNNQP